MADKNIQKLGNLLKRMRLVFDDLPTGLYLDIGRYVSARIVMKARSSKTMVDGKEKTIKPLKSEPYMKLRDKLKAENSPILDPVFFKNRPRNKSNLTFTGQFLESIGLVRFIRTQKLLLFKAKGTRRDGMTNEKLSGHIAKQGRSIFGLDDTGKQVIAKMVKTEIRKGLRKSLLRK